MKPALGVSFLFLLSLRFILFLLFGPHLGDSQEVSFVSKIFDEPQQAKTQESFTVAFGNVFGSLPVRVKTKPTEQFNYQETVKISGTLTRQALQHGKVLYTIEQPAISAVASREDRLMQYVIDIRKNVVVFFQKMLPLNSATLLAGIVLGLRGEVTPQFKTSLQNTGVMHIVAASGMNVTMVAGFFFAVFSKFFRRQTGIVAVTFCILFYVLLSGMQPSIIRAGVMMLLALGAQFLGRQYDAVYALFLTAGLMLFFSPSLLFDVGFQLSVAATVGILFLKPLFPSHAAFDDISTTLAAQLATLPILLSAFGQYGLTSILVNALILWTVPILMILGGVASIAVFVFPFAATVLTIGAVPLLWYIEAVVEYFGSTPLTVSLSDIPWTIVVGYYLILGAGVYVLSLRKREKKANANLPPLLVSLPGQSLSPAQKYAQSQYSEQQEA